MKKIRKIKNKKINSKKILGLTSLILASSMSVACSDTMGKKEYEYNRIEFSSDGDYRETRQYKSFDSEENKDSKNTFIEYSAWELREDGRYERKIKEYDVGKVTYEEIMPLLNENFDSSKVFGEPSKAYIQITDTLSYEELQRGSYFEGTIYGINKDKYVIVKDPTKNAGILIISGIVVTLGVGSLVTWKKYNDKANKKLTLKKRDN